MNKLKIAIGVLIAVIIISLGVYFTMWYLDSKQKQEITEYTPQEEITDEQLRKTIVSLYFKNGETKALSPEARLIDAKLLMDNPYLKLLEMLIAGPKSDSLVATIPNSTKVNGVKLTGTTLQVDLSREFISDTEQTDEDRIIMINSIVNTLTELNEVKYVKILIDGKDDAKIENSKITFKEAFERKVSVS